MDGRGAAAVRGRVWIAQAASGDAVALGKEVERRGLDIGGGSVCVCVSVCAWHGWRRRLARVRIGA